MILEIVRFKEIADRTLGQFKLIDNNTIIQTGFTCEPAGPDTTESGKDRRIPQGYIKCYGIIVQGFKPYYL